MKGPIRSIIFAILIFAIVQNFLNLGFQGAAAAGAITYALSYPGFLTATGLPQQWTLLLVVVILLIYTFKRH